MPRVLTEDNLYPDKHIPAQVQSIGSQLCERMEKSKGFYVRRPFMIQGNVAASTSPQLRDDAPSLFKKVSMSEQLANVS